MSSDNDGRLAKFIIANYEEVKLPLFVRGDKVLVRTFKSDVWREAIYSFTEVRNERKFYFVVGGCYFYYCILFDINKLGKITDE
jgi:BioD-like phosphotransacetylase family protein